MTQVFDVALVVGVKAVPRIEIDRNRRNHQGTQRRHRQQQMVPNLLRRNVRVNCLCHAKHCAIEHGVIWDCLSNLLNSVRFLNSLIISFLSPIVIVVHSVNLLALPSFHVLACNDGYLLPVSGA